MIPNLRDAFLWMTNEDGGVLYDSQEGMVVIVAAVGVCSLSDSQQVVHGSGKVELVSVLHRLEGSQSLGGARDFRLMRGKTVTSVNV